MFLNYVNDYVMYMIYDNSHIVYINIPQKFLNCKIQNVTSSLSSSLTQVSSKQNTSENMYSYDTHKFVSFTLIMWLCYYTNKEKVL